jgi:hypothetical protein
MKKNIGVVMALFIYAIVFSTAPASDRQLSFALHQQLQMESLFKNLNWRSIGPYFMSGRIVDIEAYENDPYSFVMATASGGLWKTDNNATTWTPLFDHQASITIGDIAISQKDKNLIWVGTGEANASRSSYAGSGVYKSTDGGKTWQNMGLQDSHHIGRILIDPADDQTVYVAASGHLYSDNEERGLFKSSDGGQTWNKILSISPKTGIIDLAIHPRDHRILYAAAWQKDRKAWNLIESGVESAIYKTLDGGQTWKKLAGGLPQGEKVGRIGLAISPSNPETVYAFIDNQEARPEVKKPAGKKSAPQSGISVDSLMKMSPADFLALKTEKIALFLKENNVPERYTAEMVTAMVQSGKATPASIAGMISSANDRLFNTNIKGAEVYRSNDGGASWKKTHEKFIDDLIYTYGYYFGQIRVSPENENIIYLLGVSTLQSTDGGRTFSDISTQGGTYGIDGVHADHHALWIDPKNPKRLLLGNDGGLNITYDRGLSWQKINNLPLAQCYTIALDNETPYNIYSGLQDNGVNRGPATFKLGDTENIWKMLIGGDGAFVQPEPGNPSCVYAEFQFGSIYRLDLKNNDEKSIQPSPMDKTAPYRFNWLSPFLVSRHNPFTIYMGANKVLKSVKRGDLWLEISPDLTDNQHTDGDVPYATITALDESPLTPEILYAGSDDGNLWVTSGSCAKWEKISAGLPKKWFTRVTASQFKKERVYVTQTGYREDDFNAYVFTSEDMGKTWKSLKANLPDEPLNVLREDPVNENVLYLGSDLGVYISLDRGVSWQSLQCDLPTNAVYDLAVQPRENELVIGTHGRGIFILPLKNIQKLTPELLAKNLAIFAIQPVAKSTSEWPPQADAVIDYYLKEAGKIAVVAKDKAGKTVRAWSLEGNRGLNHFTWNLKADDKAEKTVEKGDYAFSFKAGKTSETTVLKVL